MNITSVVLDLTRPYENAYQRFCFRNHVLPDAVRGR